MKKKGRIKGFLIDPYKQDISRIEMENDRRAWRKVMRCRDLDCIPLSVPQGVLTEITRYVLDLWVDDRGLLAAVPAPRFKLRKGLSAGGGEVQISGYGLMFSSDPDNGEAVSLESDPISMGMFVRMYGLSYEVIEGNKRFEGMDAFIEEKMRVIELEVPGFRYLKDDE
jgi:hypothetical protein